MISDDVIISENNIAYVSNKFFGTLSGANEIPSSYTRLEYIQGNAETAIDGPYINTNIKVTEKTKITVDFQFINFDNHNAANIFGVRNKASSNSPSSFGFVWKRDDNLSKEYFRYDFNGKNVILSDTADTLFDRHVIVCESNRVTLDSKTYTINMTVSNFTQSYDLYLLANNSGGNLGECANARIYSCKIEDPKTGVNVNFVPCKRLSDGTAGFFDTVEGAFYSSANSSSKKFVEGNPVFTPVVGNDVPGNLSTIARMFKLEKKNLYTDKPVNAGTLKYFYEKYANIDDPYFNYIQLEYIEANGNQWINTGYIPNQNTRVVLHYELSSADTAPIFGSRDVATTGTKMFLYWVMNTNAYRFDFGSKTYDLSDVTTTGRRYVLADGYSKNISIDQKSWDLTNYTFTGSHPIYLFAQEQDDGLDDRHPKGKIYLCNIFSGSGTDHMQRRFIPAKRKIDGVSGLLDILTCTFYESLGEPWIPGPEIGQMPNFSLQEYDFLEYAKSSSDTYIDTQFVPNQDSRVVMEMQKSSGSSKTHQYIFCSRHPSTPEFGIIRLSYDSRWRDGYANERVYVDNDESGASITQRMIIDKNKNVTYMGHAIINHEYKNFTAPKNMAIYGCFQEGNETIAYSIDMKLYWCRIYDNGVLIRNYYPATRLSDNSVGLYDFVNNIFVLPIQGTLSAGSKFPITV